MIIYWALLLIPMSFIFHPVRTDAKLRTLIFWLTGAALVLIIGLRHDVGGDWDRYISIYSYHQGIDLDFSGFTSGDYGYETIHWFSLNYLNGIYSTNLISAIFFVFGLVRFCRIMPLPWVALFVSAHFLVIVVSMGYTRQSVAAGFLLWGLVDLIKGSVWKFYISILMGALFHKTLMLMIPIGYIYNARKFYFFESVSFFFILLMSVYFLFADKVAHMYYYYIEIKYHHSSGALVRVFMSFVSAIIFFIYRDKFKKKFGDEKLWLIFSLVSIALLPASYFYSTFTDRIAIFFIPLQIAVLSRVPVLIGSVYNRTIFVVSTVVVYISALYVWLNFGNHSNNWLPYQNILF